MKQLPSPPPATCGAPAAFLSVCRRLRRQLFHDKAGDIVFRAALSTLAPVALVAALFAIPVGEARADSRHGAGSLHSYTFKGDLDKVNHFITVHMADVNAKTGSGGWTSGSTPLHYAADRGHTPIASVLISAGADVNAKRDDGGTPLYVAAYSFHSGVSVVSALIAAGADVNVTVLEGDLVGYTPLLQAAARSATYHRSSSSESAEIVKLLIASGADVNARKVGGNSGNSFTPLHYAAGGGNVFVVSMLIAAGADVNATISSGSTPLHRAAYLGHASIASLLIAAGADVNAKGYNGATPMGSTWNFSSSSFYSYYSAYAVVSVLIAAGGHWGETCASPAVVNPSGAAPPCACQSPNVGTPDNCAAASVENCGGLTPAEFYDSEAGECVPFIRCHASAIRKADNSDCECPPGAFAHGDPAIAACHAGHAPIPHNLFGWLSAIRENNPTLVAHFISGHGRNPDENYGLHLAAERGHYLAAKTLIERGADIDQKNGDGDTPLHLAARRTDMAENVGLIDFLLKKGAAPNPRNRAGWRPLDLAYHGGNAATWQARRGIMAALIAGGANWSDECTGGTIPNENVRPLSGVADCVCPLHLSERDSRGACECPAHSHSQVNGRCLPKDSAQVEAEILKMETELLRLRAALVSLNARLSAAAEMPREAVEEIAEQAGDTAQEIKRRRDNFLALARADLAGAPPPPVAMSDTAAECRMLGGEVQIHSATGIRVCSGIDANDTFCLVDSGDAYPCRGLFRHVRTCNDDYNRRALNPFFCGARCGAQKAVGKDCAAP